LNSSNNLYLDNLSFIFSATGIGVWDWYVNTGRVIYSPEWEAIAGYAPGELPQTVESWSNLVFPEDMPAFDKSVEEHITGNTPFYAVEFRLHKKDGSVVWAQDKGVVVEWNPDRTPKRIVGVIQDVTALKKTQIELSAKNEQLDFVAKLSGLGAWDWNLVTNNILYNDEYLDMLGYQQSDITGTIEEWESFIHPDELEIINQKLGDYIDGMSSDYSCEVRMRHKDGHYVWTLDMGRIVEWDANGKPARVLGGHLNIDHIKQTERELQSALDEIEGYNQSLNRRIIEGIAQLEEERQASQALYNSNPQMNFVADLNFHVIDCNPATMIFYGFSNKEEVQNGLLQKINQSIPKKMANGTDSIPVIQRFADVVKLGETSFETILTFDGEDIPFSFELKKVPYKSNWVIAVYQTDLRKLKKAEKELEQRDILLSAVNAAAAELISVDNDDFATALWKSIGNLGRSTHVERMTVWKNDVIDDEIYCTQIFEWNEGVERQHGLTHTVNVRYKDVIPSWLPILLSGKCVNVLVKDLPPIERAQMERQGIVALLVAPIFIKDDFWGFIGFDDCRKERVFTDAEENTLKSGGMLIASSILRDEMTRNLVAAMEIAQSSASAKTAFLANMSHEIRTPMNAIIGMTTIARTTDSVDKMNDCLEKISVASKHLLGILNDILDMSKIDAQKFELAEERFNFTKMIQDLYSISASKMEEKCQTFTLRCDPDIPQLLIGDELRLSQVITNLLSNAVKFTPEHGTIRLDIRQGVVQKEKVELLVAVTDTGIGISKEQQTSLFNAFEQADRGISRKFGGTGLGLAISKNIVHLMGGDVKLDSEVGKGSRFSFNIFLQKASDCTMPGSTDDITTESYNFTGKRILLIEDVDINREIVIALLDDTGIQIDCAENGQIGLDMFKNNPSAYDLIFMDIHMPVMDGYTAAKALRDSDIAEAKTLPIIAMTANAFKEDIERCRTSGMNDHIAKPVDFNILLEKLQKYLQ